MQTIPVEHLRRALRYNPETGQITRAPHWKPVAIKANGTKSGSSIELGGERYSAKRVVWALMTGEWPPAHPGYIRHRNGDPKDLQWSNLYSREEGSHCARCGEVKPVTEFHTRSTTKRGLPRYSAYCRPCTALRHKELPDHAHRYKVARYGLTTDAYAQMMDAQNGVCAICKSPSTSKRLAIDHCHTTGKVRALLCQNCNVSLGGFKDDPRLLLEAAKYLLRYRV